MAIRFIASRPSEPIFSYAPADDDQRLKELRQLETLGLQPDGEAIPAGWNELEPDLFERADAVLKRKDDGGFVVTITSFTGTECTIHFQQIQYTISRETIQRQFSRYSRPALGPIEINVEPVTMSHSFPFQRMLV